MRTKIGLAPIFSISVINKTGLTGIYEYEFIRSGYHAIGSLEIKLATVANTETFSR